MSDRIHSEYPSHEEIAQWCLARCEAACTLQVSVSEQVADFGPLPVSRHNAGARFLRFELPGNDGFWAYWQPVQHGGPAPVVFHLPGYGVKMSAHPELVNSGYNVLHINPLGYCTPDGIDESRKQSDWWPVLPDTVRSFGEDGYREWFEQALIAVFWALEQACVCRDRIACAGTSQGGGGALILSSILRAADIGVGAVCADVPFLTNFPLMLQKKNRGAYTLAFCGKEITDIFDDPIMEAKAWHALGYVDTLSHAHRLELPVMLTAGSEDQSTPADSIHSLFEILPGTRAYIELDGQGHSYTPPFMSLAQGWFNTWL